MRLFRFDALSMLIILAWAILLLANFANAQRDDDDDKKSPTPPGLYITPTALADAVQQPLSPGLTNYPNFVAGEAVKAVISPDGNTLAVLTAGKNSLYNSTGVVDTAASTQFLFLYDVAVENKKSPVLKQVIQQLNAHVGLVWAPNSQTVYAAGGCDDALSAKINLCHAPGGCVSNAANRTGFG